MSLGPLELEIRHVPGVLACQFTPTDVLVLVEPSADAAAITATVEGLLAAAAESRRVAVIGGTAAAAAGGAGTLWWLRKHPAAIAGATVASFLAATGAAAMTGTFSSSNHGRSQIAAPAPTTTAPAQHRQPPTSTPTATTTPETLPPPATTTTTTTVATTPTTAPPVAAQVIRVALPSPLPREVSVPTTVQPPPGPPPTTVPPVTTVPPPTTVPNCDPAHVVTAFHFLDNGQSLADLRRMVSSGDRVTAIFTLASGCQGSRVALVSHTMPDPVFVKAHVNEQVIFDSARAMLNGGMHTLGPVRVPDCYFQLDFAVLGAGSTPGFTYSSATGGTVACTPTDPPRLSWLGRNPPGSRASGAGAALQAYVDETGESRTQ